MTAKYFVESQPNKKVAETFAESLLTAKCFRCIPAATKFFAETFAELVLKQNFAEILAFSFMHQFI